MLQNLPISQRPGETDVRAAAHEEMSPCGSVSASMIAALDMELCPQPCATAGADANQGRAREPDSAADLFGTFPATPSQKSGALDVPASRREASGPPVVFGARVATPDKCSPRLKVP